MAGGYHGTAVAPDTAVLRRPSPALPAADPEVGVVPLSARPRIVRVGEHGDACRRRRLVLLEELHIVVADVDTLVHPLAALLCALAQHADLGQAVVGLEPRADGNALAPDVFHGLGPDDLRVGNDHVDGERAVV